MKIAWISQPFRIGRVSTARPAISISLKTAGEQDKVGRKKPEQRPNRGLAVDFGRYASVRGEVEKLAEEEMRSVDSQVIYILKGDLNSNSGIQEPLIKGL